MTTVLLRTYNANRTLLHERGLTPGWAALKNGGLGRLYLLVFKKRGAHAPWTTGSAPPESAKANIKYQGTKTHGSVSPPSYFENPIGFEM